MHLNCWSVNDVFDIEQIVQILAEFDSLKQVKVIPIDTFFNRIFQLGITSITQLDAACIGHLLGKQEIDFAIIYNDLKVILEEQGVLESYNQEASIENPHGALLLIKQSKQLGKSRVSMASS